MSQEDVRSTEVQVRSVSSAADLKARQAARGVNAGRRDHNAASLILGLRPEESAHEGSRVRGRFACHTKGKSAHGAKHHRKQLGSD